jgi:hypothetical protein
MRLDTEHMYCSRSWLIFISTISSYKGEKKWRENQVKTHQKTVKGVSLNDFYSLGM